MNVSNHNLLNDSWIDLYKIFDNNNTSYHFNIGLFTKNAIISDKVVNIINRFARTFAYLSNRGTILVDTEMLVKVNASSAGNLKADVVTEALEKYGMKAKCLKFKRHDLYTTDDNLSFVSLRDKGKVYD